MELKPALQDYTQEEFTALVHTLWHSDLTQDDHDTLVAHFDRLVEHPDGADLIYYSTQDFMPHDVYNVVYLLKHWRLSNGKTDFKGASIPAPRVQTKPIPHTKESTSADAIAKISKTESEVSAAQLAVEQAFQTIADRLTSLEQQQQGGWPLANGQTIGQQLALLIDKIVLVQAADMPIRRARSQLIRAGLFLKSDVGTARRNATSASPDHDRTVHESVLQRTTLLSDQFDSLKFSLEQRYSEFKLRVTAIMQLAEEQRVRLNTLNHQGPNDTPITFRASLMTASRQPLLLAPTESAMAAFESHFVDLHLAIQSTIARFSWEAASTLGGGAGHYSDLWQFSNRLEFDERYGFSLPLSEIIPLNSHDWQNVSVHDAFVELPVRMGSNIKILGKELYEYKHIYLAPTDGLICPKKVRVRTANLNQEKSAYQFTSDGSAPTTINWTLPLTLDQISNTMPVAVDTSNHPGISKTLSLPDLLPLPADVEFDDYVIAFPEESGIAPIYVMLKDRRHYAGVADGQGVVVAGAWLSEDLTAKLSIPAHIADQLRGRFFKQFDDMKIELWKTISTDPVLSVQFLPEEIAAMQSGAAPSVTLGGARKRFHLSHISPASEGGKVYDLDNLRITLR